MMHFLDKLPLLVLVKWWGKGREGEGRKGGGRIIVWGV